MISIGLLASYMLLRLVLERKYYRQYSLVGLVFRTYLPREEMRLSPAERRRSPRLHLQIPMFVRGVDSSGVEFLDLIKTLDISATGAFLASSRPLKTGYIAHLAIPAPPPVRQGMLPPETPPIRARVRRQHAAGGVHLIGVEFVTPLD